MFGKTHDCPGRCGAEVPNHRYACLACWRRLPAELRNAINVGYANRAREPFIHIRAMGDARAWYRDNAKPAP